MADSLFVVTLVLFITGSSLSTVVTYRDCLAVKRVEGAMRWRQWMLVCSDVVQIGFFLFGFASIIQNRPNRVELAITWALQCMACTNWPPAVFVALVPSVVLNGVIFFDIHRNEPAIYEVVLLVVIYAGSTVMARVGSSRLREHEISGGRNRSMRYLFWAVIITNEIAILTILYTCCFVLFCPERWINRLALRSKALLELHRRPQTAR
ncbi:hypothetical protein BU23DRAFT_570399 [Bimuria novae-zelandiae CBS 107.79]|uniref:Uncharacterized protein n=1 Tax=Bimuria novae-zelandiae CBS 107.79 TaxID=1447943 RepID=A0A6A5V1G6_9PLEO|nr:hypothetical protein BU23DRAFT_570399 [Bimuria novae-zelandiae CBS 107.79]